MSWELKIPNRGPDQPLDADALLELPRQLEGDDRLVLKEVLHRSFMAGVRTLRPILEGFEEMTTEERRRCLDATRRRVGLKSASDIDAEERFEAAQRMAHHRIPSTEQPRLNGAGAIEIPLSPDELAAIERKDELREQANKQRREQREHEAAERRAAREARAERWRPTGPGWEPAP